MASAPDPARDLAAYATTTSVRAVREVFDSDAALARALDVSPSRVTRWRRGARAAPASHERIAALAGVVFLLADLLPPPAIRDWLHGINANLGDIRPLDALAVGRVADVVAAAQAERTGAFA